MISFSCEHCRQPLRVPDTAAGKAARCPQCQQRTLIPATVGHAEQATLAPTPSPPTANPAFSLPGYDILGELGRGGMGVVYKARQHRPRRLVALKMVLAGEHASADALARFRREAEAIAKLSHPGIVAVHEVGEHHGRPFFTLELIEGGTLAGLLADGAVAPREAAQLVHDTARAVHFAHGKGVLHRDLKPGNVLLAARDDDEDSPSRYQAKITDFGLAKPLGDMASLAAGPATQSGAVLGTPAYMAPEQASGKKQVGPAADVYALGAILYHCLTGRPPFEAGSMLDTLLKVATEEPTPPRRLDARVPRDLETIALKCLHKDPAARYASARALADDLRRFLDGQPITARPAGALARLGRWVAAHKEIAYIAAGSLAAVLLVAGAFWLLPSRGEPPLPTPGPQAGGKHKVDDPGGNPDDPGAIARVREAATRLQSQNNLKQIGLALHNFHDNYGHFPPAAICDAKTGKPLLSWRVAILPYLEQDNLQKQFRLNEAWDSEHNKKLLAKMPPTYRMPEVEVPAGHTFYQALTGPGAMFDDAAQPLGGPFGRRGRPLVGITDGTSNTIAVVEASQSVPWTKPEDVVYDPKRPVPKFGAAPGKAYHALMGDGSVPYVSATVSDAALRAAITASGGESQRPDWYVGEPVKGPQQKGSKR